MKKKPIFLFLSFLILLTVGLGSCNGSGGVLDGEPIQPIERATYKGTHVFNVSDTDRAFIKNGKTEYTIVLPDGAPLSTHQAATEFQYFFEKATGINLPILKDNNGTLQHSASAKYISIGETSLLKSAGISYDKKKLGADGARIVTKDNTIYLVGGGNNGTCYSVYTFMQLVFNFEIYYNDCYTMDTGVKDMPLKNFDVTDIPDIPKRTQAHSGVLRLDQRTYDNQNMAIRMRFSEGLNLLPIHKDFDVSSPSRTQHNSNHLLPKDTYGGAHSDWYSNVVNSSHEEQLCYTARGNQAEFKAMTEEAAKKVIFTLENHPVVEGQNVVTITMTDNFDTCKCDKCLELTNYYGTEAGAVCIFVNEVGRIVEEWMDAPENAEHYREDFHILFFAYHGFTNAPAKYDEKTKKYVPIDDKVKLRDNVGVWYANILCDYQQSAYSESNMQDAENTKKWASLTDYMWMWTYAINYNNYGYFYDCFSYYTEDAFALMAANNVRSFYLQAAKDSMVSTAFKNLLTYLHSKLSWDTSLNSVELTRNWFNAMFADGSESMQKYFEELRIHNALLCEQNGWYGRRTLYNAVANKNYWPIKTLEKWMGYCDEALASVARYQYTRPDYYLATKRHIEIEWLSLAHMLLDLHFDDLSSVNKDRLIARLEADAEFIGFDKMKVGSETSGYYMSDFLKDMKNK